MVVFTILALLLGITCGLLGLSLIHIFLWNKRESDGT